MTTVLKPPVESEIERLLKEESSRAMVYIGGLARNSSHYSLDDRKKAITALSKFTQENQVFFSSAEIYAAAVSDKEIVEFTVLALKDMNHEAATQIIYEIGKSRGVDKDLVFRTLQSIETDASSECLTEMAADNVKYAKRIVDVLKHRGTVKAAEGLKKLGGLYAEPLSIVSGLMEIRQKFNAATDTESAQQVEKLVREYMYPLTQELVAAINKSNEKERSDIRLAFVKAAEISWPEDLVNFYDEAVQTAAGVKALDEKQLALFRPK